MKLSRILIWIFIIAAFVLFYLSLRSTSNEMEYALLALVLWGIAFLLNRFKTGEKKEKT